MPAQGVIRIELGSGPRVEFRLIDDAPKTDSEAENAQDLRILSRVTRSELEELRSREESFVALTGVVRLQAPGILIDRTDVRPADRAFRSMRRSAFSDKASLIPRTLFYQSPVETFSLSGLAEYAGVSLSVASYAVRDLARRELVEATKHGRELRIRLKDHRALLEAWARDYDWQDNVAVTVQAPMGSPERFLRRLPTFALPRFALTLHAGASLFLPHAPVEQVHLYVDVDDDQGLSAVVRSLGWPPTEDGRVHLLKPYYRQSLWEKAEIRDGLPVASDLQLMLDLWNHPMRGREQAELILEKHLLGLEAA
jgi:hypothetical protein